MGKNAETRRREEELAQKESKLAYQTKFIQVRHDVIQVPGKETHHWDVVLHPGGVAIIAIDEQKRVVLVEQWRRAIERITLELPAGLIDPNESLESCAQRELQEEAGVKAGKLQYLGGYFSSPGVFTEYIHLFLATKLTPNQLYADDTDGIDVHFIPFDEALEMIKNGTICDAKTALGILKVKNEPIKEV
jgi:ADP-ribose pyrophosphatase